MRKTLFTIAAGTTTLALFCLASGRLIRAADGPQHSNSAELNALSKVTEGRKIFRYDTFGDQAFWGDALKLHQAIAGANLGGVGPGVSPTTALAVGLKVDVDALPDSLQRQLAAGQVDLNAPATTLALLQLNSVIVSGEVQKEICWGNKRRQR